MCAAHDQFDRLAGSPHAPLASAAAAPVSGHAGDAAVAGIVLDRALMGQRGRATARLLLSGRAAVRPLCRRPVRATAIEIVLDFTPVVQGAEAAVQHDLRPGCTVAHASFAAPVRATVPASRLFPSERAGMVPAGVLS